MNYIKHVLSSAVNIYENSGFGWNHVYFVSEELGKRTGKRPEEGGCSHTWVYVYQTTRSHIAERGYFQQEKKLRIVLKANSGPP